MLGAVAALIVTIGALILALRLLGRWQGVTPRSRHGAMLEVVDRVSTGPRQGVMLLRVGSRVLIVGVGDGDSSLLGELDAADREEAIERVTPRLTAEGRPAWTAALARFGLVLALAFLPFAASSAQVATSPTPAASHAKAAVPRAGGPTVAGPVTPKVELTMGTGSQELKLSGAVGVVVMMGALTLLPAIFMLMTGFTRILIVLGFLRSAMGTQSAPPTQVLVAISVILTGVVMQPTLEEANRTAVQPYLNGEIGQSEAYSRALIPLRHFMLANTRDRDLATFVDMSGKADATTIEDVPTTTVVAAFVTSELRTAFQMGFVIFLPFLVIDLIVSSVLMSMGMFMLPPVMVSLPFKLLLFVLADGWALVMQNLVASFRMAS